MTRFFGHGQSILQVFETSIALSMVKSVKSSFFQTLLVPISWTLAIYRKINSNIDHQILQTDLAELEKWSDKWQMQFNLSKCVHLPITNKTKPSSHQYSLFGHCNALYPDIITTLIVTLNTPYNYDHVRFFILRVPTPDHGNTRTYDVINMLGTDHYL